jgi:CBS-domain-containing membrane protein
MCLSINDWDEVSQADAVALTVVLGSFYIHRSSNSIVITPTLLLHFLLPSGQCLALLYQGPCLFKCPKQEYTSVHAYI